MKKVFNLVLLFSLSVIVTSCNKDEIDDEPIRDYAVQYYIDNINIENYLKTHYIESVINNPGQLDDQNVKLTLIPSGGTQTSIWDQTQYPLSFVEVAKDGFMYKIYYLKLREGSGPNSKRPSNFDSVLTTYNGTLLDDTVFDTYSIPNNEFNLGSVILGWSEVFPKFKSGGYTENPNGTISYTDFGAGVMFVPSGLAYFNAPKLRIPAYSPLVFSFKLFEVIRIDHDGDGIFSFQEDINGDGYLRDNEVTYEDDTDHDGIPNFIDVDDDGDTYLTKRERRIGTTDQYYSFDDIPTCSGGNGLKRHLDPSCY